MTLREQRLLVMDRFAVIMDALMATQEDVAARDVVPSVEEAVACDHIAAVEVGIMLVSHAHQVDLGENELAEIASACHALILERIQAAKLRN